VATAGLTRLATLAIVGAVIANGAMARTQSACPAADAPPRVLPVSALDAAKLTLARCVQTDLDAGRWSSATTRLEAAQGAATVLPDAERAGWERLVVRWQATRLVDAGQWPALASETLPLEHRLAWIGPLLRGVSAARASWAQQDAALQARARDELRTLTQLARQAGPISEEERARLLVQGAMAGAQYERDEMQFLLEAAHDLEQRLSAGDELRPAVVLAWELEADLLRVTDRYAAASERYRDVLVEAPRRVQARIGLADAYRRLGYTSQADETLEQARALWSSADPAALALLK
jgi:hypothetical protein